MRGASSYSRLKSPSAIPIPHLLLIPLASRMAHGPIAHYDSVLKEHGFLNPNDPVAISFWIISISMVASTVFFLMESMAVGGHWKTSMNVGALVTLVAAVHYFYMREFWVQIGTSPILSTARVSLRKYFIPGCVGRSLDLDLRVGPAAAPTAPVSGDQGMQG